jgi:RimJ/RimL family protein N-acetyltransferase
MVHDDASTSVFPVDFKLKDGRACTLRRVVEDDAEKFLAFLPQTHRETDLINYFPGEFKMTLDEEKQFIRDHTGTHGAIALAAIVEERIIACGGASPARWKRFEHQTEIGLVVLEAFWGLGIGRKIMECLIDWGRKEGLRKLCLRTFAENARAIPLYESLGFVQEGRLKGDRLRADGSYGDTIIMAKFLVD